MRDEALIINPLRSLPDEADILTESLLRLRRDFDAAFAIPPVLFGADNRPIAYSGTYMAQKIGKSITVSRPKRIPA